MGRARTPGGASIGAPRGGAARLARSVTLPSWRDREQTVRVIFDPGSKKEGGSPVVMSLEIATALREQMRRVMKIAEQAAVKEVKQELAGVASVLAQLADAQERKG